MKTVIKILPLIILFASCSNSDEAILKKIKSKKQEIAQIELDIIDLENQLTDTIAQAPKGTIVSVAEIKPVEFRHYIEVQGKLDGEENVQVYPKGMGGTITAVHVKLGQSLKKGQVIASMDDEVLQKSKQQVQTQYDLAVQMFEKQQALWDQKIGSEVQYLQAKAQKEALESSLASIEKQLADTRITSPIDGTVEDLPLKVGQSASPSFPVATVVNFSSIKIVAEIAEAYTTKVKTGDSVWVYFPDLDKEVAAIVSNASNYINTVNRTFKIEVRLNSPSKMYKVNMIAVLKINDYKALNTITVPVNFVQTDANGNYVYVAMKNENNNIAKKAYLEQGQSYKGMVEIYSGLAAGDKIITSGYTSVTDGTVISF